MKYILFILLFVSSAAIGQRVYSPSIDGTPGRNQSVGISGQAVDARTQYRDTTVSPSKRRDYQSVAEVNAYLNTADKRKGGFPIFVRVGGSLSAGVWTGGVRVEYWYKDGETDGDLVAKSSGGSGGSAPIYSEKFSGNGTTTPIDLFTAISAQAAAGLFKARFFGDSMTWGTGSDATDNFNSGTPWMEYVQAVTGLDYFNYGIPGNSTSQIQARLYADSANKAYPTVIFAGTNDGVGDWLNITNKVQAMVNSLGHPYYLIIVPPGQNTPTFYTGGGEDVSQHRLDSAMTARFTGHVIRPKERMIAAATPNSPDTFYTNRGVWPARFGGAGGADPVHLNDLGSRIGVAQGVIDLIDVLRVKKADERVVSNYTLESIKAMMRETVVAQKRIAVGAGASTFGDYSTDGGGNYRQDIGEFKGNVSFKIPGTQDGLRIKSLFTNEGGKGNLEISGTNPDVWPFNSGISIKNHTRDITIGKDAATVNLKLKGNIETSLQGSFGSLVVGNGIAFSGQLTNTNPDPGVVFHFNGNRGGIIPKMSEATILAIGGGGPLSTGLPSQGEIFFNFTRQRYGGGWNKNDPYTAPGYFPFFEDLDNTTNHFSPGAGIGFAGGTGTLNDPKIIYNTQLPPASKFSGTLFESPPTSGTPGSYKESAFDGITTTRYQSVAADVFTPNYVGMTLDTAKVITQIRYRPADGISFDSVRLQGSNTSTSAGFVDLFTVPAGTPFYQYSQAPITSLTPYKYYRVLQKAGTYVLAVSELEFYGYVPAALFSVTNIGDGPATLTGTVLNIPVSSGNDSAFVRRVGLPDSTGWYYVDAAGRTRDTTVFGGASGPGGGNGIWGQITGTLPNQTDLSSALAGKQPLDADLTAIAAISPANDDIIQRKAGAWTNRTMAQLKSDLGLTKSDVGLGNVDNTSDVNKPLSSATITALALKATPAQVSQIVHDSLGNPIVFASALTPGYIPSFKKSNDTIFLKDIGLSAGPGVNLDFDTSGGKKIGVQISAVPIPQYVYFAKVFASATISPNNGVFQRYLYSGSTASTITLPPTNTGGGMSITIRNAGSVTLGISTYYTDATTSSTTLAAGKWIELSLYSDYLWYVTSSNL